MFKRIASAVLVVAVLAVTGLAVPGCKKEPDVYVEEHEEVNTSKTVEGSRRMKVE